jgi:uncharacterized protein (TIRG00374 family)
LKKKVLIGILISLVFLVLAFYKANFKEVWKALQQANYIYIIPNIFLLLLAMWLRAYRWKFMVKPIKEVNTKSLFSSTMIGFMANNLLPARLGELVRAYVSGEKEKISRSASFATIVVERIFDGFSLLFIFWLALVFSSFPEWVKRGANVLLMINLISLIVLVFLEIKPEATVKLIQRLLIFLPTKISFRLSQLLLKFTTGLRVFRNLKDMLWIVFWSLVIWGILGASNYFILMAFDMHPSFWACFIVLIFVSLTISLPSAPGYIGTFHWACIAALNLYNIPADSAKAFSIILWACQYFPITAIGLFYLKKEHLSLKKVELGLKENQG